MTRAGTARLIPVLTVLAVVAGACSTTTETRPPAASDPTVQRVERLRIAGGDWGYPSPFGGNLTGPSIVANSLIFDALLYQDADGNTIPWLASKWETSPSGTDWRFTIRDGMRWTDGRPVTAEDVAFTFDYIINGAGKTVPRFAGRVPVTEAVVESPNVVVVKTATPFASFVKDVGVRVPIFPKHIWADVADPIQYRDPKALVGSGPYKLESRDEATNSYLFVANDDHWLGPPLVKRIEAVPAANELLALQRGEIDAANPGDSAVPDEAFKPFEDSRYGTISAAGIIGVTLHFNMTRGAPYEDRGFRQAMAYAIDRQDLLRRILLGRGELASMGMLQPSDSPWFAPNLPTYPRDVARARSLLDGAGLRDVNGDGLRELPSGEPFRPQLLISSASNVHTAELVGEYLREVGVEVRIESLDNRSFQSATTEARYDMALIGYGMAMDPEWQRFIISSTSTATSFGRVHGYVNPRFERLADLQAGQLDVTERSRTGWEMQRILADDVPTVPLYVANRMLVFDKTVMDSWYFMKGWGPLYPGHLNKLVFATTKRTGF
ncbi:MAG TPA: ABC transporter substrate-binding protein [Egibacteraceae bacterium]|nr:ABC transporter substrate-binding protein [Egibacteraceae bacterium]